MPENREGPSDGADCLPKEYFGQFLPGEASERRDREG
jgi:hypothetical protein